MPGAQCPSRDVGDGVAAGEGVAVAGEWVGGELHVGEGAVVGVPG